MLNWPRGAGDELGVAGFLILGIKNMSKQIVTGTILDDSSAPVDCAVNFEQVAGPIGNTFRMTAKTFIQTKTVPATGVFSVQLEEGYWEVAYFTSNKVHKGVILTTGGASVDIATLVQNVGGL